MLNEREIGTREGVSVFKKLHFEEDEQIKGKTFNNTLPNFNSTLTKHLHSLRKGEIRELPQSRKSYCF